jgi:hypothetical protein
MESTEGSAYLLGEQLRDLGDAIGKLLQIDPTTGESSLIKLIDSFTTLIGKIESAVAAYERFKESFIGGAILDISTAPIRAAVQPILSHKPKQLSNQSTTLQRLAQSISLSSQ